MVEMRSLPRYRWKKSVLFGIVAAILADFGGLVRILADSGGCHMLWIPGTLPLADLRIAQYRI